MDVTSYLLGKKAGGGSAPVLQDKEVEITENGETTITADSGYDGLSSVEITTDVQSGGGSKAGFINGGGFCFERWDKTPLELENEIYNLPNWFDTSTITSMYAMLSNNQNISFNVDLSNWDISNVESLRATFAGGSGTINISNWNTSKVVTFSTMFNASKYTSLNLSSLKNIANNGNVDISYMFYNCSLLTHIDIRNFEFTKIIDQTYYTNAFTGIRADCEIIVKNDACKSWVLARNSNLTNVKTVAEYEGN